MQNLEAKLVSINHEPVRVPVDRTPTQSGVDVLSQFKANIKLVGQLQHRLNFMTREVTGLVKPRKA